MAEVIDFASRRPQKKPPTYHELVEDAQTFVGSGWEKFARSNQLNDFIVQELGVWSKEGASYTNDLNAISAVEQQVGLTLVLTAPSAQHLGWRAGSVFKSFTARTPDMPFETYARCFNILMFIKLKRDLLANGMAEEL